MTYYGIKMKDDLWVLVELKDQKERGEMRYKVRKYGGEMRGPFRSLTVAKMICGQTDDIMEV